MFYDVFFPLNDYRGPLIPYSVWIIVFILTGFLLLFFTYRLEFYDMEKDKIKGEMNIDAGES